MIKSCSYNNGQQLYKNKKSQDMYYYASVNKVSENQLYFK